MTQNILVGVDGSANGLMALTAAADLAEQHPDMRLVVVFVRDVTVTPATAAGFGLTTEGLLKESADVLETTVRESTFNLLAHRPIEWTFDVVAGHAAHELLRVANERSASLIVIGGRGHSFVGGLVLGSAAQKLVRHSPISVLVVRHPDVNDRVTPQAVG